MEIFGRMHVLVRVKSGGGVGMRGMKPGFFFLFQFSMIYCNTIWFSTFNLYLKCARKIVIISNIMIINKVGNIVFIVVFFLSIRFT